MSTESYLIGWLVYLSACCGLLLSGWLLTRSWRPGFQLPTRAGLAALFLLPWSSQPQDASLAPAILVSLFDALVQEDVSGMRAGKRLLLVVLLMVLIGLVLAWRSNLAQTERVEENTGVAPDNE